MDKIQWFVCPRCETDHLRVSYDQLRIFRRAEGICTLSICRAKFKVQVVDDLGIIRAIDRNTGRSHVLFKRTDEPPVP